MISLVSVVICSCLLARSLSRDLQWTYRFWYLVLVSFSWYSSFLILDSMRIWQDKKVSSGVWPVSMSRSLYLIESRIANVPLQKLTHSFEMYKGRG